MQLDHDLMANIWENIVSILAGNLNSGRSYLTTTVLVNSAKNKQKVVIIKIVRCYSPFLCNHDLTIDSDFFSSTFITKKEPKSLGG